MSLATNGTDRLYIKTLWADTANMSQEIYRLTRPTSLGDVGYKSAYYGDSIQGSLSPTEGVMAIDKDIENIPIHASADTTNYAGVLSNCVTAGYCTLAQKNSCISGINAAKGTTVSISTVFPTNMWTNRLTETTFDAWYDGT